MIETAENYFKQHNTSQTRQTIKAHERAVRMRPVSDRELRAFINHGRWVIMCPNCRACEFLWEDKLFFCSLCGNERNDGKLYKVILPDERQQIEHLLESRFLINRNWFPNETIEDLERENKEYGVS